MDNGCREYIFLTEFFMVRDADAMKLFMTVMGKTLQHVHVSAGVFVYKWKGYRSHCYLWEELLL